MGVHPQGSRKIKSEIEWVHKEILVSWCCFIKDQGGQQKQLDSVFGDQDYPQQIS